GVVELVPHGTAGPAGGMDPGSVEVAPEGLRDGGVRGDVDPEERPREVAHHGPVQDPEGDRGPVGENGTRGRRGGNVVGPGGRRDHQEGQEQQYGGRAGPQKLPAFIYPFEFRGRRRMGGGRPAPAPADGRGSMTERKAAR